MCSLLVRSSVSGPASIAPRNRSIDLLDTRIEGDSEDSTQRTGAAGNRHRDLKQVYAAGRLAGRRFYWENERIELDTLGWEKCLSESAGIESPGNSPDSSVPVLARHGKVLYRVVDPSAIAVAVLRGLDYPVVMLTQWSGKVRIYDLDTRGHIEDENIITDFLWESVDSARIESPRKVEDRYRIRMFFGRAGVSDFFGKESLELSRSQIMGTRGLDLLKREDGYSPERNQYRLILKVYTVANSETEPSDIISAIEEGMDELKLDLSYRIPRLVEVQ